MENPDIKVSSTKFCKIGESTQDKMANSIYQPSAHMTRDKILDKAYMKKKTL
jgi:hypothetical protein